MKKPSEQPTDAGASKGKGSLSLNRSAEVAKGKSRFFQESIRLNQKMVDKQLLGYGRLVLGSKPRDYVEGRFCTGSSSSGELDSSREESYQLAHALGVSLDADLACGFNFREVGLLPPDTAAGSKFAECCSRFRALQVERDLLEVEDSKLVEASEYHLISVSCFVLFGFAIAFVLTFCNRCLE